MEIKSYKWKDLAQLYFPNSKPRSATSQFKRWLDLYKPLQKELAKTGFRIHQRVFTPLQVKMILYHFGEP